MGKHVLLFVLSAPLQLFAEGDAPRSLDASVPWLLKDNVSTETIWPHIAKQSFELSSASSDRDFHFETMLCVPQADRPGSPKTMFRLYVESTPDRAASLIMSPENLPVLVSINDSVYQLRAGGEWSSTSMSRWGVFIDADHMVNFFAGHSVPPDEDFRISLDLLDYLRAIMTESPVAEVVRNARTVFLKKSNGTTVWLRYRTPNDQQRFGIALSELWCRTSNDGVVSLRAFQTAQSDITRLQLVSPRLITEYLGDSLAGSNRPKRSVRSTFDSDLLRSETVLKPAIGLWHLLMRTKPLDLEPLNRRIRRQEKIEFEDLTLPEAAYVATAVCYEKEAGLADFARFDTTADDVARLTIEVLRRTSDSVAMKLGSGPLCCDDPILIWRGSETSLGGYVASTFYAHAAAGLLNDTRLSYERRTELCDAMGNAGFPSFLGDGKSFLGEAWEDPFFDAVLRSRWQWVCDQKHIDACIAEIDAEPPTSKIATIAGETLMRLDRLDLVPDDVRQAWWQQHVTDAKELPRQRALTVVSQQPSGRRYLLDQRAELQASDPQLAEQIASVLRARVEAAQELGRTDFISDKEAKQILAALNRQ